MNSSITTSIAGTENGIVSKKLLSGDGGNITLFAFDKGQSLDNHSTPRKAMILILEGQVDFNVGKEKKLLKKDDYILLQENEEHSLTARSPLKMLLIMIKS